MFIHVHGLHVTHLLASSASLPSHTAGTGFPYIHVYMFICIGRCILAPRLPVHYAQTYWPCLFRLPSMRCIQLVDVQCVFCYKVSLFYQKCVSAYMYVGMYFKCKFMYMYMYITCIPCIHVHVHVRVYNMYTMHTCTCMYIIHVRCALYVLAIQLQ